MQTAANIESRPRPLGRRRIANPVAWAPSQDLDSNEWASAGRRIGTVGRCVQWLLGDWIVYGNEKFGERYSRASRITGYDPQTLMNMVYVASRFPISRRREDLSWSHHEALAALEPEEQDSWLDQAAGHRWSVSDLRAMLRIARRRALAETTGSEELNSKVEKPTPTPILKCPRCGEEIAID